ncbi:Uncharacterised protein [uncultured archaeon]|nr:Uncharacterised protein [uncultured archaeon]
MKNTGKLSILMVAVIAIGIFALPAVLSVGTGQHQFNNGAAVQCGKCHANPGDGVFGELSASGNTGYVTLGSPIGTKIHNGSWFWTASGKYDCSVCHVIATGGTAKGQHTGVTIHVVCATCHGTEYTQLTNTTDAHHGFAAAANVGTSATYACIGCHTAVTVTGSPSYTYGPSVTTDGITIGNGPVAR